MIVAIAQQQYLPAGRPVNGLHLWHVLLPQGGVGGLILDEEQTEIDVIIWGAEGQNGRFLTIGRKGIGVVLFIGTEQRVSDINANRVVICVVIVMRKVLLTDKSG